jgi:outer membrane protein OmpA-like peptidoglycan-associated protein
MKWLLTLISCFFVGQIDAQEQFTVYFDFDIDEANGSSNERLTKWINANPNVTVNRIFGYTDSVGEAIYNTDLSERRAAYVYKQLQSAGIATGGLEVKGLGEAQATGNSRIDRKVVLHYSLTKAPESLPVAEKVEPVTEFTQKVTTAERGEKIKVPNLNFYNNSDVVLPESQPILAELLNIMQSNPLLKIEIQGHICCQIVEENLVSQRRAEMVYKYLIKNGISSDRLSFKSFGSTKPVYKLPEKTEAEKVANRRVEIEIIEN